MIRSLLFSSATIAALVTTTHAESPTPAADTSLTPLAEELAVGVRIGGYGFRRDEGDSHAAWDECRMNGVGLFATRGLTNRFFVEAGLDVYSSEPWPMQNNPNDLPIDRVSGLVSAAIGARTTLASGRIIAYAQLGLGVELTQVSVPYGEGKLQDRQVLPDGYIGMGGEIRAFGSTYFGAGLRVHAMGNFDYDPDKLAMQVGWTTPPTASEVFAASPDLSAQAQFYVRHAL